jgi:HEPN domain-containing protein
MISVKQLRELANTRIKEAEILLVNRKYDGAVYLCGYAIELALKSRICIRLRWKEFPEDIKPLLTHDFNYLIRFTGKEDKIKSQYVSEWSIIEKWKSGSRYNPIGTTGISDAQKMVSSAKKLVRII